MTNKSL